MDLCIRRKLKALPIWNSGNFSLRSVIATFITISEQPGIGTREIEAALGRLSDSELGEYSQPGYIPSTSEAIAFCSNKSAQSSQYLWKHQDNCLVLVSKSKFAENRNLPGVIFEFIIRTGKSSWTVYKVPDPCEILDFPMYFERNELITHSHRPVKLPILARREQLSFRLGKIPKAIAMALTPLPVSDSSLHQRKESRDMTVSGVLPQ